MKIKIQHILSRIIDAQINRATMEPRKISHKYAQLIFNKEQQQIQWRLI